MIKTLQKLLIVAAFLLFLIQIASSVPNSITLQGKLTNQSGASQQGTYNFTFRIYDDYTSGNALYEQNQNISTDANGVYDVILKNINLSFDRQYFLGITIGTDSEATPRINLTSSPYTFRSNVSEELNRNNNYFVNNLTSNNTIFAINLNLSGNINTTGTIQAAYFVGDGSLLGGINAGFSNNSHINVTKFAANNTLFVNQTGVVVAQGRVFLPDGSSTIPSLSWSSSPNQGLYRQPGETMLKGSVSGDLRYRFSDSSGLSIVSTLTNPYFGFGTSDPDTYIYRDGIGIIALRSGTSPETLRIYNTYTSSTNFERFYLNWTNNVFTMGTENGTAGGTMRDLVLATNNIPRITISANGSVGVGNTIPNNTLDVSGNANISGKIYSESINVSGTVQASYFVGSGALLTGVGPPSTNNSDINVTNFVANSTLFVNGSRIGIFTDSPAATFHIKGSSPSLRITAQTGYYPIDIYDVDDSTSIFRVAPVTGEVSAAGAYSSSTGFRAIAFGAYMGVLNGNRFVFNSGSIPVMSSSNNEIARFTDSAFGIRTSSPLATLDVVGNVSVRGIFFVDNESQRVGIGNTMPNSTLHVSGNVNVTGVLAYGVLQSNSPHFFATEGDPEPICMKAETGVYVGCMVNEDMEFKCRVDERCNRKYIYSKLGEEVKELSESKSSTKEIEKLKKIKEDVKNEKLSVDEAIDELSTQNLKELNVNELEKESDIILEENNAPLENKKIIEPNNEKNFIEKVNGSVIIRLG